MKRRHDFASGFFVLSILVNASHLSANDHYTTDAYIRDVLETSLSLQAKKSQLEAATLDEKKVDLKQATLFNSTLSHTIDRVPSQTLAPSYQGMDASRFEFDFAKHFSTGTKARVGARLQRARLHEMSLGIAPIPPTDQTIYQTQPFIELSQSLWQDAFGKSNRLLENLLRAQTAGRDADLSARKAAIEAEAKLTYARLVFARKRKAYTEKSLDTARQIFRLIESKLRRNLSERSDLLQAEALLTARMMEHNASLAEDSAAQVAFENLVAPKKLNQVTLANLEDLKFLNAQKMDFNIDRRKELAAFKANVDAQTAAAETEADKTAPNLDLFAQYGLTAYPDSFGQSFSKLNDPYQPTYTVGLKFSMFLDRELMQSQVSAARLRSAAAESEYREVQKNLERDLSTLTSKRSLAAAQVKTATEMEKIQNSKLANERSQYGNGRSTTYQLLMFTQDLASAELSRLQAYYDLIVTDIQLSLFQ